MENQVEFPNIEQYSVEELIKLIMLAEAILNAHKPSKLYLLRSRRRQTQAA